MKKLLTIIIAALVLSSCTSLKLANSNAAIQAGAAAAQALTISDSQIVTLCREYMVQSDAENTVLPASNNYSKRLANIMSRFKNIGSMNVNYAVYQSNTVNAFASGDGSVRVYSGLMDVMDDDEIFAVIGHELGHVQNKDTRDAYRNAYLIVAARYGIAAFSDKAGAISQSFLGDLGQQLAQNAYSRKQEYEADDAALQFCVANGVNPYAMYNALNVLIRLEKSSGGNTGGALKQMFSSHPDTSKRASRAKSNADAVKGKSNTTTKTTVQVGNTTAKKITVTPKASAKPNASTGSGSNTNTPKVSVTPK